MLRSWDIIIREPAAYPTMTCGSLKSSATYSQCLPSSAASVVFSLTYFNVPPDAGSLVSACNMRSSQREYGGNPSKISPPSCSASESPLHTGLLLCIALITLFLYFIARLHSSKRWLLGNGSKHIRLAKSRRVELESIKIIIKSKSASIGVLARAVAFVKTSYTTCHMQPSIPLVHSYLNWNYS